MKLTVEMPGADTKLRDEFELLGFQQSAEQEGFEGAKIVRLFIHIAAVAGAVAGTVKAASEVAKDTAELVETLKPLFHRGFDRYKADPNDDFSVHLDGKLLVSSQMSDDDCKRSLDTLAKLYDR